MNDGSADPWTSAPEIAAAQATDERHSTPEWLLGLALAAVIASLALFIVRGLAADVVGYTLASLVAFTLVAFSRRLATKRLFSHGVALTTAVGTSGVLILVFGLLASGAHAWLIARHFA